MLAVRPRPRRRAARTGGVALAALALLHCAHAEILRPRPQEGTPAARAPRVVAVAARPAAAPRVQDVRPPAAAALYFHWPLRATAVSSLYGGRQDPLGGGWRFHAGVDLQAPYGAVARSVAAGTVRWAGRRGGHGRLACVAHRGGFVSCYAHLAQLLVARGDRVGAAAPLGLVGNSGRSTAPHLHLEVQRHGSPLDPLDVLGATIDLREEG